MTAMTAGETDHLPHSPAPNWKSTRTRYRPLSFDLALKRSTRTAKMVDWLLQYEGSVQQTPILLFFTISW